MNAMAWIAIAAIIIPNAIKAYELYLTHKKQANPNPTENQHKAENQIGKIDAELRLWRFIGIVCSVGGILSGLFLIAYSMVNASRLHPRFLIVFTAMSTLGVVVSAWLLRSFLKPKRSK